MSRITTTAIVLALTLGVPATLATANHKPSHGQSPAGNGQLTLTAKPSPITFGGAAALTGKLGGGQTGAQMVVIEANPAPFTGFKALTTVTTATNGSYNATVKPSVSTRYRARAKTSPATVSGEVTVGVRIRVGLLVSDPTPRRGTKVVFSGRAYPAHDGAVVSIRRRTSTGSFATIARTTLVDDGTSRSRYRRAVRITSSGVYQVRVTRNDTDHLSGTSRTRLITVHA